MLQNGYVHAITQPAHVRNTKWNVLLAKYTLHR